MFGFLIGKELDNGDIKYGLCFSEHGMDKSKEGLVKRLDNLLSDDRPAMLKNRMPINIVSKNTYLGDKAEIGRIGGIEQSMASNIRYYLSKDGIMYRYSDIKGTLTVID